jgi:hypothetical protein
MEKIGVVFIDSFVLRRLNKCLIIRLPPQKTYTSLQLSWEFNNFTKTRQHEFSKKELELHNRPFL